MVKKKGTKKPVVKGARITGPQRGSLGEQFRKRYDHGTSIRSIAQSTGRSYGFVHRVLVEAGAKMRGRGGDTGNGFGKRVK